MLFSDYNSIHSTVKIMTVFLLIVILSHDICLKIIEHLNLFHTEYEINCYTVLMNKTPFILLYINNNLFYRCYEFYE